MVSYVSIKGFEEFNKYTETIDPSGPPVLFYFSGSKGADGHSWCPDCVEAPVCCLTKKNIIMVSVGQDMLHFDILIHEKVDPEVISPKLFYPPSNPKFSEPVVKAFLGELQKNIIFAYVDVGDKAYWKEKTCPFRTDSRTKLMVIPTIIKWKGVQRLEGSQCNKRELLQMLFEDED